MKIKICGLNPTRDVQLCIDLKVDYLGFIFYERSPRNVSLPDINVLSTYDKKKSAFVAVTVNPNDEFIKKNLIGNFDFIQLHGTETKERMIRPLQNCVNLFAGASGHKENYPQSKVITSDPKEMMSNSAVLQLQIVLYARELGMEDILQDGNEQMQLALAYRKAWDAANDGDSNITQLMQLNMKICVDLINIFIFASEKVIPEKE